MFLSMGRNMFDRLGLWHPSPFRTSPAKSPLVPEPLLRSLSTTCLLACSTAITSTLQRITVLHLILSVMHGCATIFFFRLTMHVARKFRWVSHHDHSSSHDEILIHNCWKVVKSLPILFVTGEPFLPLSLVHQNQLTLKQHR